MTAKPTIQLLTAAMTASGVGFLANGWMLLAAQRFLHRDMQRIPKCHTAIVPGAKAYPNGSPSPVLEDRLQAALDLYRAGRVQHILVSGDDRAKEFSETNAMRRWLLDRGVPESDLTCDPKGIRTLATMQRARWVYRVRQAVVCTQAFHLARSVFLARRSGIQAVGLRADRRIYLRRHRDQLREFFARQVAFLDSYLFS